MAAPETLSAVVPVFDEVESLPAFHAELLAALDGLDRPAEVVYVDDGSTDGSTELLQQLHAADPDRVTVVVLRRNFGKSGALAAGFEAARGELVVTLDADGQDVPDQLPLLLDAMDAGGLDMVGGWRASRIDRRAKRWTSRMYNAATRSFTGLDLHDFNTGFKLMRREVVEELPLYGEFHRFVPVLAHDLGFRVGEVAVTHRPRQAGRSKYLSLLRFPKTLLDLLTVLFLTRFADRPLYLFGGVGALLSVAGVVILSYLSGVWLLTDQGIGTRPLLQLGVLSLLVGVQLVGTGFIGDVLRHSNARQQPPFRVRSVLRGPDGAAGRADASQGAPAADEGGVDAGQGAAPADQDAAAVDGAARPVAAAAAAETAGGTTGRPAPVRQPQEAIPVVPPAPPPRRVAVPGSRGPVADDGSA